MDPATSARCVLAIALAGCTWAPGCGGGAERPAPASPAPQTSTADGDEEKLATEIGLETGELMLEADGPEAQEIAVAVGGAKGSMVLFGCDEIEARTQEGRWVLARVRHWEDGGREMLIGKADREDLARLAEGTRPELLTCDAVFPIDERGVEVLQQFLEGRVDVPEETWTTQTFSVEGLRARAGISNLDDTQVRMRVWIADEWIPEDGCGEELLACVGDRAYSLGELRPLEREDEEEDPTHEIMMPRARMQWLAAEPEAELAGCGAPWPLDRLVVETLRELVGAPPEDAEPPPAWEPPETAGAEGAAGDGTEDAADGDGADDDVGADGGEDGADEGVSPAGPCS